MRGEGVPRRFDAVVVGAGFAGLYMLYRLRELGLSVRVLEAGDDVGGTWYWNRYPGARCDVESILYSYSFSAELEQEWTWSERYATQPEILKYINHVADKFDLRRDIDFNSQLAAAEYDEHAASWQIETADARTYSAQFLIMATGCLSVKKLPDFPGIDTFEGELLLTASWPRGGVDLSGKRIAVIGTGSTAIQAIPQFARTAKHVTVFQRTPNFSIPAHNRELSEEERVETKARYREIREAQRNSSTGMVVQPGHRSIDDLTTDAANAELEARWKAGGFGFIYAFDDAVVNPKANERIADFVRSKIHEIVDDPDLADLLTPTEYPIGAKRLCVDIEYFETYNRPNVSLVDLRSHPIREVTTTGLCAGDRQFDVDTIVLALGFDAITGALLAPTITGIGGQTLGQKWSAGPLTYLGLATAGFPNLFMITGPFSPSVLSNVVVSIEQHVEWIAACIAYMRERDVQTIEATGEAERAWVDHVHALANKTLMPAANTWYNGANVPGKARDFMVYVGGVSRYRRRCDQVASSGYEGFDFDKRTSVNDLEHAG
ncbi:MAG: hypothetical protein QOJ66_3648 [Ilumatobacteraceae bacterium]